MAEYTLRIQLVGKPSEDVYEDLHERMATGGFIRTVTGTGSSGKKTTSDLPHGTYYGSSTASISKIRDWAKSEASEAWGDSVVFVAKTETWAWGKS